MNTLEQKQRSCSSVVGQGSFRAPTTVLTANLNVFSHHTLRVSPLRCGRERPPLPQSTLTETIYIYYHNHLHKTQNVEQGMLLTCRNIGNSDFSCVCVLLVFVQHHSDNMQRIRGRRWYPLQSQGSFRVAVALVIIQQGAKGSPVVASSKEALHWMIR